ncbi:helix-turn-helix transcriptional regulator [Clostridium perfringens]|uniref:helix-turn-helix transcriptional regulator n=1 Tax=Clostridium perfringens TaxID=1502 RepID=UPI00123F780C|nr:helix-turn-helix transcriptional regulator [Clostridium perfringens]MCX0386971.1 helix-turn-helix transcriptional regulator [Clostridium perfringens]
MAINKVKLYRMELGITQGELAKRVEVSRQTISLIESNKYNPSINLCIKICECLNKTLNDLFWEVKYDE